MEKNFHDVYSSDLTGQPRCVALKHALCLCVRPRKICRSRLSLEYQRILYISDDDCYYLYYQRIDIVAMKKALLSVK